MVDSDEHSKGVWRDLASTIGMIAGVVTGVPYDERRVAGRKRFDSSCSSYIYPNVNPAVYMLSSSMI